CVLSIMASRWLLQRSPEEISFRNYDLQPLFYRKVLGYALAITIYLVLLFELQYQLQVFLESSLNRTIILGNFNLAFIVALYAFAVRKNDFALLRGVTLLGGFGVVLYVLYYNFIVNRLLQAHFLYELPEFTGF